ncbi:MAG: hypothetical protein A4E50_00995 [Methanosaeta sp. PtaB.Bin087]|nr:MAG: hypothetical protein A4E50_00995 [Methanosaeta sp. PtaB.Bin087]
MKGDTHVGNRAKLYICAQTCRIGPGNRIVIIEHGIDLAIL